MLFNEDIVLKLKNHVAILLEALNKANMFNDQMRWEFLEFKIRNFSICHWKKRMKFSELNVGENENNQEYLDKKQELEDIYGQYVEGIKVKKKC